MNANEMVERAEFLSQQYDEDGEFKIETPYYGAYRRTLIEGPYAFKAARTKYDTCVNQAEWDFYCMTTDEIRAMLAKPVYISRNGKVIVMEKLRTGVTNYKPFAELLDAATNNAYGFEIDDLYGSNWGMREDGTVVASDYGAMEWQCRNREYKKIPESERETAKLVYQRDYMVEMLLTNPNN